MPPDRCFLAALDSRNSLDHGTDATAKKDLVGVWSFCHGSADWQKSNLPPSDRAYVRARDGALGGQVPQEAPALSEMRFYWPAPTTAWLHLALWKS